MRQSALYLAQSEIQFLLLLRLPLPDVLGRDRLIDSSGEEVDFRLLDRRLRDPPCILSARTEEIRIVPQPFSAASELNDWQVPGKDHGNCLALAWLQHEFNCNRAGQWFTTAGVWRGRLQASICAERT